jgi:hypothetical protein
MRADAGPAWARPGYWQDTALATGEQADFLIAFAILTSPHLPTFILVLNRIEVSQLVLGLSRVGANTHETTALTADIQSFQTGFAMSAQA